MKRVIFIITLVLIFFSFPQGLLAQSEYQLPYPGILPDSPFYFFKITRDKVVGLLISDPFKKAEFDLLIADKRLNAGFYLFNGDEKKKELALSTISKGENYFEEAIEKTKEAKKRGIETNDLLEKIFLSVKKHKIVLRGFEKKAPDFLKEKIVNMEKRLDEFEKNVNNLKSK